MLRLSIVLSLLAVTSLAPAAAHATKPEDAFGGKVMLSDKPFPTAAKSPGAYISEVKKQAKTRFTEDKEKKHWKIHYAAFFKKPVNDLEITVKFVDVTAGGSRIVDSYEQFLEKRGQRVITGNFKLQKWDGKYDPNSRIHLIIESKGKTVAEARFDIEGEGKKYKGKVEFSEDEAAEPDKGEP